MAAGSATSHCCPALQADVRDVANLASACFGINEKTLSICRPLHQKSQLRLDRKSSGSGAELCVTGNGALEAVASNSGFKHATFTCPPQMRAVLLLLKYREKTRLRITEKGSRKKPVWARFRTISLVFLRDFPQLWRSSAKFSFG